MIFEPAKSWLQGRNASHVVMEKPRHTLSLDTGIIGYTRTQHLNLFLCLITFLQ